MYNDQYTPPGYETGRGGTLAENVLVIYGNNVINVQLLETSLLGEATVLRLESDEPGKGYN